MFPPLFSRRFILIAIVLAASFTAAAFFGHSTAAQDSATDPFWSDIKPRRIKNHKSRHIFPDSYRTVRLRKQAFEQTIAGAPPEFAAQSEQSHVEISMPLPDGTFGNFRIEESPIMEPSLAARLPDLKTYAGQSIDDPTVALRFSWTPQGLQAIILSPKGIVVVMPYASDNSRDYIVFYSAMDGQEMVSKQCLVGSAQANEALSRGAIHPESDFTTSVAAGTTLRTYRLAVAATGEFTQQYGGGSVTQTQTAIAQNVNLINAIYQRELSIRFTLIDNTAIIFTDPNTDGYTNSSPSTMLNENQAKLDSVIGSANYDIGHVYGAITGLPSGARSFSGIAFIGVACTAGQKGKGASTMGGGSTTETIFVSGITHEFGHQLGATHSFNTSSSPCGPQRSAQSAWEPGGGSTLMAYSICGTENLQPSTDQYFHTGSLEQIMSYVTASGTCAALSPTGNTPPTVEAGPSYTIPARTPFALTAVASDPNGDALTYAWEEYDLGTASPPNTDDGSRPIFRSYPPTTSPTRLFPSLRYILNNANDPPQTYTLNGTTYTTGEALPTTNRTMNFRVTARDNRASGGGIQSDAMQVTVVASAGPFQVTQPNTSVSWAGGSTQTITWNVAGTSAAPINATNVRLSLSTDGGNTFPLLLAATTANDGAEAVTLPNTPTTQARVKVEAVGNIFFDISDANFTITAGSGCSVSITPASQSFAGGGGTGSIAVTAPAGCSWSVTNVPTWVSITSGASGNGNGTVSFTVSANGGASPRSVTLSVGGQSFTIYQGINFLDVPPTHPFYEFIGRLSARGVTQGCGGGNFCPDAPVTRDQMAAFIIRARGEFNPPTPTSQRFNDVPPDNPFYAFIDRMAALGITQGCSQSPPLYCPTATVTREQMAAFIIRALGEFNPPTPATQRFIDVPPSNPFYAYIDRMAALGITNGCAPGYYCPTDVVTRSQMAKFLVAAFNL